VDDHDSQRLNKLLALRLGVSRREADDLISKGNVSIDGQTAELGARVAAQASVFVNGAKLPTATQLRYILFHKPVGYVCSRKAQGDNPTIYDLLPDDMRVLKPVGRLDKDSSGLLLLTNDGDFAHSMTHPSFKKIKVYTIGLNQPLEPLHQQMISDYGVEIGDGASKLSLERLSDDRTEWQVTMSEGRNRQIRRTFAALGYEVTKLHRITFGKYQLSQLAEAQFETVQIAA